MQKIGYPTQGVQTNDGDKWFIYRCSAVLGGLIMQWLRRAFHLEDERRQPRARRQPVRSNPLAQLQDADTEGKLKGKQKRR